MAVCHSPLRIAHLDFVVYIRMQWRPRRTAGECSSAPRFALPGIFLTLVSLPSGDVAMRQCSPGQTMEATPSIHFTYLTHLSLCVRMPMQTSILLPVNTDALRPLRMHVDALAPNHAHTQANLRAPLLERAQPHICIKPQPS